MMTKRQLESHNLLEKLKKPAIYFHPCITVSMRLYLPKKSSCIPKEKQLYHRDCSKLKMFFVDLVIILM